MSGVFSQADGAATRMSESVSSTNQYPPGSDPLPERESQLKMSRFARDAVLDPAFAGALPVGIHVRAAADSSLFEWRRKPVAEFAGLHVWQVSTTKDGRSPPYLPGLSGSSRPPLTRTFGGGSWTTSPPEPRRRHLTPEGSRLRHSASPLPRGSGPGSQGGGSPVG